MKEPLLEETDLNPWTCFLDKFNEKYFSEFIKNKKEVEFITISQEDRTIAQYEATFS